MNKIRIFILLNVAHVIIQTFKSIYPTKGRKIQASIMNALACLWLIYYCYYLYYG